MKIHIESPTGGGEVELLLLLLLLLLLRERERERERDYGNNQTISNMQKSIIYKKVFICVQYLYNKMQMISQFGWVVVRN